MGLSDGFYGKRSVGANPKGPIPVSLRILVGGHEAAGQLVSRIDKNSDI
jgi:hypothetical protein